MKQELEQIDAKLDKINDRLNSIDQTLIKQEGNLEKHMMRTSLNEQRLAIIEDEIKPILKHVIQLQTVLQIMGYIGGVVGVIATIIGIAVAIKELLA